MAQRKPQFVRSKLAKTNVLLKHHELKRLVPETRAYSKKRLRSMLDRYRMVYVKPNDGSSGIGVMKVEKGSSSSRYRYHYVHTKRSFPRFDQLFAAIERVRLKRKYIIQKGIYLLKHKGRPFDIRVMVQLSPQKKWEVTGVIARIAHPNKPVTNRKSGGSVLPLETVLRAHSQGRTARTALINRINSICLRIMRHYKKTYPGLNELGIDVALDQQKRIWIIEVNTRPVSKLFNALKDKRMIKKIVRYSKAYGRDISKQI